MISLSTCHVSQHPLIHTNLTVLRDRKSSLRDFRSALHQLALLVGIDASKDLQIKGVHVETPLAPCEGYRLEKQIVIIPVLRAGLGMIEPLLGLFPDAHVGHVGLYRDEETLKPHHYYFKAPFLEGADIFR